MAVALVRDDRDRKLSQALGENDEGLSQEHSENRRQMWRVCSDKSRVEKSQ